MRTLPGIPAAPGALPVLGHALQLIRDPLGLMKDLPNYGDLVQIKVGRSTVLVVCDPELTRQVFLDDRIYDKGGPLYDRVREVLGNGLATCPYTDHRRQRRLIQPAFHRARIEAYAGAMSQQIDDVVSAWGDDGTVEVLAETTTIAARTLVATLFATAPPELADSLLKGWADINAGLYRRMLMPAALRALPTLGNHRYGKSIKRFRAAVEQTATDYRAAGCDHGDLLSTLMAPPNGDDEPLSDIEVRDQIASFLLAGIETTASAIAWSLFLVAHHPEVEQKLHTEVDTVLHGKAATFQDLPRLELTRNIVNEALRLHTPPWMGSRITQYPTRLGRFSIPSDTAILFSTYIMHRLPQAYLHAERFDPDRWRNNQAKALPRGSYIPFGAGARKCPGDLFSLTETTLALATITARWKMEPVTPSSVPNVPRAVWGPQGLRMQTKARYPGR
ncbi:cytochrome P450 [Streptomyces sp. NPDC048045]|uniref:cytochrome P450 n=1 Tax=Streptomyces sp. NPDC048045 TaxID=3154710 RepID=UPI00343B45CB